MANLNRSSVLVPDAVFRIWHFREKIEVEAAAVFGRLAKDQQQIYGIDDEVMQLSLIAEADEHRHRELCRAILKTSDLDFASTANMQVNPVLGPKTLSTQQRILYAAVAMGCVTESLSTALLMQMYKKADEGIFKNTIHAILKMRLRQRREQKIPTPKFCIERKTP